ncbi:MAG TPA: response regulator [Gemmatimonadales bacterium]
MATYRLLFIDDDAAVLSSMAKYFRALGHDVFTATSGREGLGLHAQVQPHVSVVDLMMPGMTGIEVLEHLRGKRGVVLMLTGYGEIETAVEAMRLGAESFLQKPIDMSHLAATVEKAAEKADLEREVVELRARLAPNLMRLLIRIALFAVLVAVAVGIGAVIGADRADRPVAPIPVPITPLDSGIP